MVTKLEKMQRYLPSIYRPTVNPVIRGILKSWASEDDRIVQAAKDAKEQLFIITAQLQYLDALGSNVGVFRPTEFNLADALFRELIPALSYAPKQIKPTIKRVLDIFFGLNNPRVKIAEINPNEIKISIPSSVPSLRRDLRGSHHFHNYSGTIVSVDNLLKEIVVDLDGDTKVLVADEFAGALFGQGTSAEIIQSSSAGTTGVVLQFSVGTDLSVFDPLKRWMVVKTKYPGSFMPDATRAFTVTKQRGVLGQVITAGQQISTLTMLEASGIPDQPGFVGFNFGFPNQEVLIKYFGRPNNSTLLIDPGHIFANDHVIGSAVNVVLTPYLKPRSSGDDYSVYLVGVEAARILAQRIVEAIAAAGVVIRWTIITPIIDC